MLIVARPIDRRATHEICLLLLYIYINILLYVIMPHQCWWSRDPGNLFIIIYIYTNILYIIICNNVASMPVFARESCYVCIIYIWLYPAWYIYMILSRIVYMCDSIPHQCWWSREMPCYVCIIHMWFYPPHTTRTGGRTDDAGIDGWFGCSILRLRHHHGTCVWDMEYEVCNAK